MSDAHLYQDARAYIEATATPRDRLAAACGIAEATLNTIETAGAFPAPTYVVFPNAIRSPIRTFGDAPSEGGEAFYCPAVLSWLRRALLLAPNEAGLLARLEAWFAADFAAALRNNATDARRYAWTHLFDQRGAINEAALAAQVRSLNADWLDGGWAVCLKLWNGHHVVTKDLERARIAALTQDATREPDAVPRLELFDAVERLESVMLPFAPHERPHGTPGLFIDRIRERYAI